MFQKRFSRALALTVVATLVMTAAAFADGVAEDGDLAKNGNDISFADAANPTTNACSTRITEASGDPVAGFVRVSYNGNKHFDAGSDVTVTLTPSAAAIAAGISVTGGTSEVPAGWGFTNTSGSPTFDIAILSSVPDWAPNAVYTIGWTATGPATSYGGPGGVNQTADPDYDFSGSYTITINCSFTADPPASDTTPPVVTVTPPTPDGNDPWFVTSPVSVDVTATDDSGISSVDCTPAYAESSSDDTSSTGTVSVSAEGETTVSCTATDNNGNTSDAVEATVSIDTVDPAVAVTGFANGAIFYLGDTLPTVTCLSSDGTSGIDDTAGPDITAGGLSGNGVGSVTYTCTASDVAGNSASDSKSFSVFYSGLSGILQPINLDNSSVFSRGKAVPVKFRLAGDEFTGFNFASWTLKQQQTSCFIDGEAVGGELEPVVENPSNGFRYDSSADQYIYNANFKDKAVGTCWKVIVTLDSGQKLESAVFRLQK